MAAGDGKNNLTAHMFLKTVKSHCRVDQINLSDTTALSMCTQHMQPQSCHPGHCPDLTQASLGNDVPKK